MQKTIARGDILVAGKHFVAKTAVPCDAGPTGDQRFAADLGVSANQSVVGDFRAIPNDAVLKRPRIAG